MPYKHTPEGMANHKSGAWYDRSHVFALERKIAQLAAENDDLKNANAVLHNSLRILRDQVKELREAMGK